MSERTIGYDVEPSAEEAGALHEHARIRMNFAIMAKGNCQPEVTVEMIMPPFPGDELLLAMAVINSKALTIATMLGRRFERVYAYLDSTEARVATILGHNTAMPEQEEIEGWLVSKIQG